MRIKKYGKAALDIVMGCLLLFLLSYPLTRGLYRHGVMGAILLALFVLHHFINLRWYRSLCKGRYTLRRCMATVLDMLLLAATLAVIISSLYMSGEVFSFLLFPMTGWARSLHNCATAWLFIMAAAHLGLHWSGPWRLGGKLLGKYWIYAALIIFFNGFYCCAQSGLGLFSDQSFMPETFAQFLLQYLGMALGFYMLPQLMFYAGRTGK